MYLVDRNPSVYNNLNITTRQLPGVKKGNPTEIANEFMDWVENM